MGEPSGARDSLALSNLLICHESESSLNEDDDETNTKRSDEQQQQQPHSFAVAPTTIGDDDEGYVAELVRKENRRFEAAEPTKTTSSFDRLIAIDWILTVRNTLSQQKEEKKKNPFFRFRFRFP